MKKIVFISCFDWYENRIRYVNNYFVNSDWKSYYITSNYDHIKKEVITITDQNNFIYIDTIKYKKNLSFKRIYSHYKFSKDVIKKIKEMNPDLVYCLIPPNSLTKELALLKKEIGYKLIFDVIDMWPETMPIIKIKNLTPIKVWGNTRNKWINEADHVVTECDLYQTKLKDYVDKSKMTTVYLAREIKKFAGNPNPPKDKIVLCYLGSINNIIDIPTIGSIVEDLRQTKSVILHIVGDGEKREELIKVAKESGAEVIYHGKVFDSIEKQKIFDLCHYGLNIMKESVFVGLTMKSMDYFEAGLPIINNIHGDTWDMVETYGIGVNYDLSKKLILPKNNVICRENTIKLYREKFGLIEFNKKIEVVING
ncbi:hypothetical protein [Longibaculum muris]|uniref:hypothetical protein n=1 Tax=Longibaculum muris TaxID=1796628 RepID=UPI003AB84E3F